MNADHQIAVTTRASDGELLGVVVYFPSQRGDIMLRVDANAWHCPLQMAEKLVQLAQRLVATTQCACAGIEQAKAAWRAIASQVEGTKH